MAKAKSNTPTKSPLELSLEALKSVKEEIAEYLSTEDLAHLRITVDNALDRLVNRFSFLSGRDVSTHSPIEFKPVTNFMGDKIESKIVEVTDEDVDPTEAEKQAYIAKVDKLYAEIDTLDVTGILNAYSDAEGEQVLRGVAKRVDVGGYDVRELTEPFVEEIIAGKIAKEAAAKEEEEIQKQLAELDKK